MSTSNTFITVNTSIIAPLNRVWDCWTNPQHITRWNFASDDWCCPSAENDAVSGGHFSWRMEAKDGSMGFDFAGTYDKVEKHKAIRYRLGDGRRVEITFLQEGESIQLTESFEAEGTHTDEQQRAGWQAILENFRKYVEGLS